MQLILILLLIVLALVWVMPMVGLMVCAILCAFWAGFRTRLLQELFGEPALGSEVSPQHLNETR